MFELREYQKKTLEALFDWWGKRPTENPLVVLPTAAGKTVIFSELIKRLLSDYPSLRVMVLAHTRELVEQAAEKLRRTFKAAPIGVYCAGLKTKQVRQITIASRDSIRRAAEHVGRFDIVIIDEAHLINAKSDSSYKKILDALSANSPGLTVVGFTATPYRNGSGPIYGKGQLFSDVCYSQKIPDLLRAGFLCPITAKQVAEPSVTPTDGVKLSGGDYNVGELRAASESQELVRAAVTEWHTLAFKNGRRATAFFCVSVEHAKMVQQELDALGIRAPLVTADTDKTERSRTLADFAAGELTAICNVACLTTGWDAPILDCIALLRPTRSLGLFVQIVGRGLRLHPGKKDTLLLDFGGNLERFGPIDTATPPRRGSDKRTKPCPQCREIVGFFKRKCPCGFQFEPAPYKVCPKCDSELPTAAKACGCGHVFANHDRRAGEGEVLSSGDREVLRQIGVQAVRLMRGSERAGWGAEVLYIAYHVGGFGVLTQEITRDHVGWSQPEEQLRQTFSKKWREIAQVQQVPRTVREALSWQEQARSTGYPLLRPVDSVTVTAKSKYKKIIAVHYRREANVAAASSACPD